MDDRPSAQVFETEPVRPDAHRHGRGGMSVPRDIPGVPCVPSPDRGRRGFGRCGCTAWPGAPRSTSCTSATKLDSATCAAVKARERTPYRPGHRQHLRPIPESADSLRMDVMDFAPIATQPTAVEDAQEHALERLASRYQAQEREEAIERQVREMRPGGALIRGHGETKSRRPTIRDVAERAGVSKSLVSLVMRGEPMVREDKRRRVRQAADELGYRNPAVRALPDVRSNTIGILVADLRNPLLVDVVERSCQVFEDEGLATLLISAVMPARSNFGPRIDGREIGALKDLRVEAMLIVGSVPDSTGLAQVLQHMPVVVAASGGGGPRVDVVRNDDHLGMRLVVDHLVAAGHTAVAHLGGAVAEERVAGYCAAMAHHGLESEIVVTESDFTEDAGYRGTARLLRGGRPVTAIAAVNDLAAIGAMSAIADAGLRVPSDVAVTGYDDTFVAAIRQVSLTSVNPDSSGIGARAAHCVLRRIDDPGRPMEEHLLPPRLLTRFSSGMPAGGCGAVAPSPEVVNIATQDLHP
jgi:DNA-binding LacI/PurR family transcriptional regulator